MNILFVCTGNTCRSPMAEALMNSLASEKKLDVRSMSAGLSVQPMSTVSENSVRAMQCYGVDITNHIPKQITEDLVEEADLILTMTEFQSDILKNAFPLFSHRIHSIARYTKSLDISDPYGGNELVYKNCASQIHSALIKLCERISQ